MDIIQNFRNYLEQFVSVSDSDFQNAIKSFQFKRLKKNAYFVKSGEVCQTVAYVNKGILRSYYINKKGNNITYSFHLPNSHVTSKNSFVNKTSSVLSIQAIEPTELLIINYNDLQELYKSNPLWQEAGRLVTEFSYMEIENNQTINQTDNTREKYLNLLNNYPQIIKRVPTAYIASYLGVSRETLSRIKNKIFKMPNN